MKTKEEKLQAKRESYYRHRDEILRRRKIKYETGGGREASSTFAKAKYAALSDEEKQALVSKAKKWKHANPEKMREISLRRLELERSDSVLKARRRKWGLEFKRKNAKTINERRRADVGLREKARVKAAAKRRAAGVPVKTYKLPRNLTPEERKIAEREYYRPTLRMKERQRYAEDPLYRLKNKLRSRIRLGLKRRKTRKHQKAIQILGAGWDIVAQWIESQFTAGMSWENMAEWHIDHIIPLANAPDEATMISLMYYKNLRPAWKEDNLKKHTRIGYFTEVGIGRLF